MRVCIVTTGFPRWPRDSRVPFVLEAARAIQSQGAFVRVIAMHSPGAKTHEVMDGIEVIRPRYLWPERLEVLRKDDGGLPVIWRRSRAARLAVLPFVLTHSLAIMRYASDCDLIHANWTLSAICAWLGQPLHHRPIVVTVQGSDILQATRIPGVAALTSVALNRAERVLALSSSLAKATAAAGVSTSKVEIVPNGVDIDLFHPPDCQAAHRREPLLLFVGALIERKATKYLIQAMPSILARVPTCRLTIVGEGPEQSALTALVNGLALGDRVAFTGPLPQAQVSERMREASLFVLPSLEEGLGVVLLEALASGTPCVASEVDGIPDIVSPSVGLLVPPADPDALGSAILELLQDEDRRRIMAQAARQLAVDQYSWSTIGARIVGVYQDVLEGRAK
jgi:glycosyltransferase involved in cell wall biosynthesis